MADALVTTPLTRGQPGGWRGPRLFAAAKDEPRARRATDLILLVASLLTLVGVSLSADPTPGFVAAFEDLLASLPGLLAPAWQIAVDLLVLLAVILVVGALVRRRGTLVRDALIAALVAVAVSLVFGRVVTGSWPDVWESLRASTPPPWYPAARLGVTGAVVLTTSPHMSRPVRRLGRWVLWIAAVGTMLLGTAAPLGTLAGVLVATVASTTVHLVFGSCDGRPGLGAVRQALVELGVPTRRVGAADRQEQGLFLVGAEHERGDPLVVKVYGRDAYDSALLSTVWRKVWFRDAGTPIRLGRLQQVEHEAFVTLYARQAGIVTDTVVTAGATTDDDALLVLARAAAPLREEYGLEIPDEVLREIWALVDRLAAAKIAHGKLDERNFVVEDGRLGVVDFRGAAVSAQAPQLRADEAQALVTTVLLAGEERALRLALDHLGAERLAGMLPYVQLAALTSDQRRRLKDLGLELDELRARAADEAGVEPPKLQQLRRITAGSIIRVVLPAIAVVALLSAVSGIDFEAVVDELRDANWAWIVLGFVIAQTPRLTQAVSTMGASPLPLPLGPVYALQLAVSYVNLAIPSTAARMAVNIRFFQLHGVPPGGALAAGALDGFSGFIVQIALLLSFLLFTPASLDLRVDGSPTSDMARLLALVVVLALAAVVVVLVLPKLRHRVLGLVRQVGGDAIRSMRGLQSPRRITMLFGGNLATEVLFATSLLCFTRAFWPDLGLGEALLINISTALLAGLMPIPGGIGVTEGSLIFGLVQAGVPEEIAFAAVILYRLASFYMPPVWGFFAMRWLEKNHHL